MLNCVNLKFGGSSEDRAFLFFKVKQCYHDHLSSYVLLSAIIGDSMDRLVDSYPYINKLRNLQERPRGRVVMMLARNARDSAFESG